MTLSGPDALRALDEAVRDIRREEDDIVRKLARGAERIAKLRETEADLLRQFAKGHLEADKEAELSGRITDATVRTQGRLKERASALAAAATQLRGLDKSLGELVSERAAALAETDQHQATLRTLAERIATAISRDPEHERQRRSAAALEAMAIAAAAKARQADIDREQKGRPYREDPLFMYLWNKRQAVAPRKPGALIAWLDRWVADLIDFEVAQANYLALNELPIKLREHAKQQAQHAAEAERGLDAIERAAIDAAGGGAVREALDAAQARMLDIDRQMIAIQDQRDAATSAQSALAQVADPDFDRAVTALALALGGRDIQSVIAAARAVPLIQEDALLTQLDDIRQRVTEEEIDTHDQSARLKTLAARRRELEDIEYEFKTLKYDDPRSTFSDDQLIGQRLNDFLTAASSAGDYWTAWTSSQSWSAGTSEWGGGVGLPRRGRFDSAEKPSSGAFSRPRQPTAGAAA